MARWSDVSKLKLEMDMLQAKVKWLHKRGCDSSIIADKVDAPERSVRVIIKHLMKKR